MAESPVNAKVAVVLGASDRGGIGAAIARRLAAGGAQVVVAARREALLAEVAADIGAVALACDITSDRDLAALAARTVEQFGRLDIAVNSTGINHGRPIASLEAEDIRRVSDVHFLGTLLFIKHLAGAMQRAGNGGSIVLLSTLTASVPGAALAAYAGSKAAVEHIARIAALEYGGAGIRVNAIAPGLTRTAMTEGLFKIPRFESAFAREAALGRITHIDDVAAAAVWLAGDEAFMTGQVLQINGGASLGRLPRLTEIAGQ